MIVFLTASVVVLIGLVIAVVLARIGGAHVHMAAPVSSSGGHPLLEGKITSTTLSRVRFERAARGYRMDQVDEVLDRLRAALAAYENDLGASAHDVRDELRAPASGSTGRADSPRAPAGD